MRQKESLTCASVTVLDPGTPWSGPHVGKKYGCSELHSNQKAE